MLISLGCGSSNDDNTNNCDEGCGNPSNSAIELPQFEQLFEAICNKALECGATNCDLLKDVYIDDELGLNENTYTIEEIRTAIQRSDIYVLEERLGACFQGIENAPCPPGYGDGNLLTTEEFIVNCGNDGKNAVLAFSRPSL